MKQIKVKLDCHWTTPKQLVTDLKKLIPPSPKLVFKNVVFTDSDDFDFVAVFNHAVGKKYPVDRTLYFQCEASWVINNNFPPNPYTVHNYGLQKYHCPIMWYMNKTYTELEPPPLKTRIVSGVISDLYWTERQKFRRDFVFNFLDRIGEYHHYGRGDALRTLRTYKGCPECKSEALLPYKYTVNSENTIEANYFTEKIVDPIVSETLCFYDGCPNLHEWIDPNTYVRIDMSEPEKALGTIIECIRSDEWSHKIDAIRREKNRIMNEKHILAFIAGKVNELI